MKYPPPIPGLILAGAVLAVLCAIECWAFVVMYSRIEKTPEGKHLFRLSVELGLVFTLTVVFAFVPGFLLVKALIQLVVFAAIAAELWVRIVLLRNNQNIAKKMLAAQAVTDAKELKDRRSDDSTSGPHGPY